MSAYPLAVISPMLGQRSETFIQRHMADLLPGGTVVAVRGKVPDLDERAISYPYRVFGARRKDWRWFYQGSRYALGLSGLSPVQVTVAQYLARHSVQVILSEYLDQSLKWLDVARKLGLRFFAHAHGYDVSRMLRDPEMCRRYRKLEAADGIITMSEVSRRRLMALGLSGETIHVIPYGVDVPGVAPYRVNRAIPYAVWRSVAWWPRRRRC